MADTDRELLELAAKAAGIIGAWAGGPFPGIVGSQIGDVDVPWNPLRNDGQALRLAVKLGISPNWGGFDVEICAKHSGARNFCYVEPHDSDPYAATRRAIVRAAAEIGRAM